MGEEIKHSHFRARDYRAYKRRMSREMALLSEWFAGDQFSRLPAMAGFELEAWLVDDNFQPAPVNEQFLARAESPFLVPELARFNIELNVEPQLLQANSLKILHGQLSNLWEHCWKTAQEMGYQVIMTGILPTLRDEELNLANMSAMKRYRALNTQVMQARKGRPLQLDIVGEEHLCTQHRDVMLESAATSFQVHRQIPMALAVRYYNAAIIASAPMVAIAANSPLLFGRRLWHESRIPLFEQAVEVGGYGDAGQGPIRRVSFGSGYVQDSLEECFLENAEHYPILLPVELHDSPRRMSHVRLHNGTIWRWNRPLIGFDSDDTPHLRIEHRVMAAGPSVADAIANAAFFYGLQESLAIRPLPPERQLVFSQARDNFYQAARHGISTSVSWLYGQSVNLRRLLLEQLIPMSREGLENLHIDAQDIDLYLGIISERAESGQTGAEWQLNFLAHGNDLQALVRRYLECQQSGNPVHQWPLA